MVVIMKSENRKNSINWVLLGLLALSFALYNQKSYAEEFQYEYFSLQNAQFPPGFTPGLSYFNHTALGEDGKVYGTLFHESGTFSNFAAYENGVVTLIPGLEHDSFLATTANKRGVIGGLSITDFDPFTIVAALIEKGKLIQLPGHLVCDLTDGGTAFVHEGDDFSVGYSIVKRGMESPISFGPIVPVSAGVSICGLKFNNQETIAGTTTAPSSGRSRGFILAKGTNQQPVLLKPKATDTDSVAFDINNEGNVFGFSYNPDGIQRVGLWQKNAGKWAFKTYFTQGTADFPTISSLMVSNDKNQMVINVTSPVSEQRKSYIITEPGKRLDLNEITKNIPNGDDLCTPDYINRNGDMAGFSCRGDEYFLKRIETTH